MTFAVFAGVRHTGDTCTCNTTGKNSQCSCLRLLFCKSLHKKRLFYIATGVGTVTLDTSRRYVREVRYVLLTSLLCDVATPVVTSFHPGMHTYPACCAVTTYKGCLRHDTALVVHYLHLYACRTCKTCFAFEYAFSVRVVVISYLAVCNGIYRF